jgi:hypothetical protein
MSLPKILSGARAILKIDNKVLAFATNVGYRISIPHAPINVLGRYSAARHEPLGYDVTVNCGVLRFTEVGEKGNAPDGSSQIMPKLQDIINKDDIKIEILDRKTDQTILVVDRCRCTDRGGNLSSRDLLTENWTFIGIIASNDESGPQDEASPAGAEPPNSGAAS